MEFDFNLLEPEQQQEYRDYETLQADRGWQRLVKELDEDMVNAYKRGADADDLKELGYWKGCRITLLAIIGAATSRMERLEANAMEYDPDPEDDGQIGLLS